MSLSLKEAQRLLPFPTKTTVPVQIMRDHLHISSARSDLNWQDFIFRQREKTFRIYFVRAKDDDVKRRQQLLDHIEAALDADDKILFVEFCEPDEQLACHRFNYAAPLEELYPMALRCQYFPAEDLMSIDFLSDFHKVEFASSKGCRPPYDHSIFFDLTSREVGKFWP